MIPIDFIFDLHFVSNFGPGPVIDQYGGADHDVFFTFSSDRNAWCIDVAWLRSSGDIIPWKKHWVASPDAKAGS